MEINALLMDLKDNVVTCVMEVPKESLVVYHKGKEVCTVVAEETIPNCHKAALVDFEKDQEVIKYGELIGKTSEPIKIGHLVSDKNIYSVSRDYESEFIKEAQ